MKTFKIIVTVIVLMVLTVCCLGGAGSLYYSDISCSDFFATGILGLGAGFGYLCYPYVKKILKGE